MSDPVVPEWTLTVTLLSFTTASGVLYTCTVILYCLCIRLSYSQLREKIDRQRVLTFALLSIMIICATIGVVFNNEYGRITFITYSNLPGGPIGLPAQAHAWTSLQIINVVTLIASILGMAVLLQRVWIVYSGTPSIFFIPIVVLALVLYLAYVVTSIVQTALGWAPLSTLLPNLTHTFDTVTVVNFWMGIASTVVMTLMITTRLMLVRQRHIKLMGKTDIAAQYMGIVAMLVESYSLNTAWNIGYVVAYILRDGSAHNFFTLSRLDIEVISYYLLIYRVLSGRAWDRQTQNQISTLRWQHSVQPANDDPEIEVVNINVDCVEEKSSTTSSGAKNV